MYKRTAKVETLKVVTVYLITRTHTQIHVGGRGNTGISFKGHRNLTSDYKGTFGEW